MASSRILGIVFVASCIPTGGPPDGSVHGVVGATLIDATIDDSSSFVLKRAQTCSQDDQSVFTLTYGDHRFSLDFRIDGGLSVFGDVTYPAPAPTTSNLKAFEVVASGAPAFVSGTVAVGISGPYGRRTGDFHVAFSDGSAVDGDFDLPFSSTGDSHCGGSGGGGGHHFDD